MASSTTEGPAAPITGLSHIQLLVSDVQVSAAWYSTALGLEPYAEDLSNGYIALRHRAAKFVIVLTAQCERSGPESAGGPLDHLALAVPDGETLAAWADHLRSMGIDHAGVVPEGGNPSLQLVDPDGISIELVAPAPRMPSG